MNKRLGMFVAVAATVLLSLGAAAQTAAPFSADVQMHSARGMDMTGKMFYTGTKVRMDMETPGGSMSNITDITEKKHYMLMRERKMYIVTDLNQPAMGRGPKMPEVNQFDPTNPCSNQAETTCKKVGTETVDGRSCDKWETSRNGKVESTMWLDQKLHIPVRTVHADGTSFELTNIKEGPQANSLFEVPAGYQKFDMGNMMGGMAPPQR